MNSSHEIVVIGSGVFGLSAAWELAKTGHSVVVLDRAPIGTEASGWALGRLDPLLKGSGATGNTERDLPAGQISKPQLQQDVALSSYAVHREMTGEIQEVSGIDIQVDEQPTLQLFYSEDERESGVRFASEWTDLGFKTELVSHGQIEKFDSRFKATEHGGAVVHGPYFIDSMSFTRALAGCARSAGVRFETATVTSIETNGEGHVTVHSDQGHYDAADVVIAAGPWTTALAGPLGVDLPVLPSKGEILRLRPADGEGFSMHLHGPCSLVNKKDGHVWVAATVAEVGFDKSTTAVARTQLLENAATMMTGISDWPVEMHTACFRPATPDDLPIIGKVAEHVSVATGGGGNGIVQCLYVGKQISAMIELGASVPENHSISLSRFRQ